MLNIENLHASIIGGEKILKGVNLKINAGEVHAIMGPNGAGKSTLSRVIAGHPAYEVTEGTITYEVNLKSKNLLELEPDERARLGIFKGFQYPIEIPGLSNREFLRTAFNSVCQAQGAEPMDSLEFDEFINGKIKELDIKPSFLDRDLNVDFSGGEKKRNEILQMSILSPRIAFLDETDSGLDIDALKTVAKGVNQFHHENNGIILITHYYRLLDYVKPNYVHVFLDGKIVKTGGHTLAREIEDKGYENLN